VPYTETTTTDRLATLHFDHEKWDVWVDVHRDANSRTGVEMNMLARQEGCYIVSTDDCDPEHLPGGIVRYQMAYLEDAECP
jgi:hypothetical protein